jgi:hypothetical protein
MSAESDEKVAELTRLLAASCGYDIADVLTKHMTPMLTTIQALSDSNINLLAKLDAMVEGFRDLNASFESGSITQGKDALQKMFAVVDDYYQLKAAAAAAATIKNARKTPCPK